MRARLIVLLFVMVVTAYPGAAGAASGSPDEVWGRWMKPRGDAVDQLAARVRHAAQSGAEQAVAAELSHASLVRAGLITSGILSVLVVLVFARFGASAMKDREANRVRMVLDAARRRDTR